MFKTVEIHFPSDPELLSVMRAAVAKVCHIAGFSKKMTSKIVLALDEACSNIIRHTYKGEIDQEIKIISRIKPTKLEFYLLDQGDPVDSTKIKSRELHDVRPGGLGVYLIKSVMDEVKWEKGSDNGNRLYMYKTRPKRRQSES